ncbi:hypothetical protein BLOT_014404 [Blomia tropicalis]|nr:hypothetical protein BLOT_014404 [Blomia tropicalis]
MKNLRGQEENTNQYIGDSPKTSNNGRSNKRQPQVEMCNCSSRSICILSKLMYRKFSICFGVNSYFYFSGYSIAGIRKLLESLSNIVQIFIYDVGTEKNVDFTIMHLSKSSFSLLNDMTITLSIVSNSKHANIDR